MNNICKQKTKKDVSSQIVLYPEDNPDSPASSYEQQVLTYFDIHSAYLHHQMDLGQHCHTFQEETEGNQDFPGHPGVTRVDQ